MINHTVTIIDLQGRERVKFKFKRFTHALKYVSRFRKRLKIMPCKFMVNDVIIIDFYMGKSDRFLDSVIPHALLKEYKKFYSI